MRVLPAIEIAVDETASSTAIVPGCPAIACAERRAARQPRDWNAATRRK